jgi:hypothetical protein
MNKKILLSLPLVSIMFNACMYSEPNVDKKVSVNQKNSLYLADEFVPNTEFSSEDDIYKTNQNKFKTKKIIELSDILVTNENRSIPRNLINKKIDNITFKSKKLGNTINLLLTGVNNVSIMYGPNVDLNIPINLRIHNKNLFETLQRVAYSVGYYLTYDQKKETLYLADKQIRNYRIPAGLLIDKTAENQLTGGASITLKPEDPFKMLEDGLKNAVGSKDKGIFIDKTSGLIMIKEHPMFIKEIDNYILDFVRDRSRQFMLETAVVEISHSENKALGVNVNNLSTVIGDLPVFVNSVTGGSGGYSSSVIKSSYAGSNVSLDAVISSINDKSETNVVDRPRVVVFNHSVGFVNRGSENSYISSIEIVQGVSGNPDRQVPKTSKYQDGLKIAMRVDAMPYSDDITLSLAPSITTGRLEQAPGAADTAVEKLLTETREIMTNVNLKNGDIFVLGGIKSYRIDKTNESSPWFDGIPILGDIFQNNSKSKTQIETLFLVKVNEIGGTSDSYQNSSLESFSLLKEH